jgi:hypothetical protein
MIKFYRVKKKTKIKFRIFYKIINLMIFKIIKNIINKKINILYSEIIKKY